MNGINTKSERVPAGALSDISFPDCSNKCLAVEYFGVCECNSICPWKFSDALTPNNKDNCWEDEDRCNDCPVDYPNKECHEFRANGCVCDKPIFNPQVDGSIKCDICHKPVKVEVKQC